MTTTRDNRLVLEVTKVDGGYQVWPVVEQWGMPMKRVEMGREEARLQVGHDPAETDPSHAATLAIARSAADRARERHGWRHVEVRDVAK